MGAITSRVTYEESQKKKTSTENVVPQTKRILPVDPRSPAENFTRTPIQVTPCPTSTEEKSNNVKLLFDPRSPTQGLTRTPLMVPVGEGDTQSIATEVQDSDIRPKKSHHSIRPCRLTDTSSTPICEMPCGTSELDPRSPSTDVPRTPLEECAKHLCLDDSTAEVNEKENQGSNAREFGSDKAPKGLQLFVEEGTADKNRKPLSNMQNSQHDPRAQLQVRQCRQVEEEFAKSHATLLKQLDAPQNVVTTKTDFVEDI